MSEDYRFSSQSPPAPKKGGREKSSANDPHGRPETSSFLSSEQASEDLEKVSHPINLEDAPGLAVYFGDRRSDLAVEWLLRLIPDCPLGKVSESYIAPPSLQTAILIFVCSNDPTRMIRLFRLYKEVLKRKLLIAVMNRSTPKDRARLLTVGFDDVFDGRTLPLEATVRVNARLRRLAEMNIIKLGPSTCDMQNFKHYLLSDRENVILAKLCSRMDKPVSQNILLNEIHEHYGHSNRRSLHVMLSHIRKKLHPDYAIIYSRHDDSYMLKRICNDD
ncbi:winged helix-turn-helix domain-containing protein [Novosphingobium sp. TH158]|uniref:winged helix-turn-helix domain-containing protein n=1 Tax=Novosphingobium sp. TH158 TaxID=2067455 RepID=UPI000C7AC081|nr:winged helix-turn-helix domain-containing protein [Novosphingobium sp. TH158]